MNPSREPLFSIRHVIKGASLYGGADVFVALGRFLLIAILTRLSPATLGLYALVTTTIVFLTVGATFGLPSAILIRFRKQDPPGMAQLKATAFYLLLLPIAFFSLAAWLWFHSGFAPDLVPLLPWMLLWGATDILAFVPKVSLQFKEKIKTIGSAKIGRIVFVVGYLLARYHSGSITLGDLLLAEASGATIELVILSLGDRFVPRLPSRALVGDLLALGAPLCLISIGLAVIEVSDRYVVSGLLGIEQNGLYSTAAKVAVVGVFLSQAFNAMWTPYFYGIVGDRRPSAHQIGRVLHKLLGFSAAGFGLLMLGLPQISALSFNGTAFIEAPYDKAMVVVAPLLLGYFLKVCYSIATPALTFYEKNWQLSAIVYSAAVVNLAGNVLVCKLVPAHRPILALSLVALMTAVSYGLTTVLGFGVIRTLFPGVFIQKRIILGAVTVAVLPLVPMDLRLTVVLWLGACIVLFAATYSANQPDTTEQPNPSIEP